MATNWANKFHNKWFVRVDGRGIPVYGSLIDRPVKPRQGRWIEIFIPNQICCETPPTPDVIATVNPDGFEEGGTIVYTISNGSGILSTYTMENGEDNEATLTALVSLLNTELTGFGTFTNDGDDIILSSPIYPNLTATVEYQPAG